MKKGVIVILFLLSFSLLSVSGADIASVDGVSWLVAPSNVYEFSEQANLTVFFDQSGSTLQNYNVTYSGISISSIANPSNCVYDNSNSVTSCPSGNLKFSFDALEVTNDTTYIWTVTTNDSNNGIEEWNLTLSVLNDDIAPRITSQTPTSFGYKQNGVFNIVIGYEESESGFEQATLLYKDNSAFVNDVRGSVTADPVSSTCTSTSCTFSFDADTLMGGSDNPYLDAYFNVSDKAGNTNNSELYHLFIDYETPEVKDLSPGDGMLNATNNLDFGFSWDDNSMVTNTVGGFDPQIECEV
jgi:hypothetical protein